MALVISRMTFVVSILLLGVGYSFAQGTSAWLPGPERRWQTAFSFKPRCRVPRSSRNGLRILHHDRHARAGARKRPAGPPGAGDDSAGHPVRGQPARHLERPPVHVWQRGIRGRIARSPQSSRATLAASHAVLPSRRPIPATTARPNRWPHSPSTGRSFSTMPTARCTSRP